MPLLPPRFIKVHSNPAARAARPWPGCVPPHGIITAHSHGHGSQAGSHGDGGIGQAHDHQPAMTKEDAAHIQSIEVSDPARGRRRRWGLQPCLQNNPLGRQASPSHEARLLHPT